MGVPVSNTDSFIDEVTEEVRREKLYQNLRRYAPYAIAAVLVIVGVAAYSEYRAAQAQARAAATGDALLAALEEDDVTARAAALAAIEAEGSTVAVTQLLTAGTQQQSGEHDAAADTLASLATNQDVPQVYRDLAAFKSALLPSEDAAARMLALEQLSQPGQPFRLLALEQIAYLALEGGDEQKAIETFKAIAEDAALPRGLQLRVERMMLALGVPPETE